MILSGLGLTGRLYVYLETLRVAQADLATKTAFMGCKRI
jgi:hypothetical protein